jgi:hypothetical protein
MSDALTRLQDWYAAQCDGDWEHLGGIKIGTVDNPGWRLSVRLAGTALAHRSFAPFEEDYAHADRWVRCWVADGVFEGACGPHQLNRVVDAFLEWAERPPTTDVRGAS